MTFPAKRFIRMTTVDGAQVPGYAPVRSNDVLEAYAPFLFESMAAGLADLEGDVESRMTDVAVDPEAYSFDGGDEEDDADDGYFDEDSVVECLVHENGDIEISGITVLTRDRIFAVYGVADGPAPKL